MHKDASATQAGLSKTQRYEALEQDGAMTALQNASVTPMRPVPSRIPGGRVLSPDEAGQEQAGTVLPIDRTLLMRKVIEAQEAERRRIARDIHDETEQLLGNAIFRLDMCLMRKPQLGEPVKNDLGKIREILINTVEGLQNLSQSLRPSLLDDLGLEASLAWLFRTSGLTTRLNLHWKISGLGGRLPRNAETALFRIIQEACNNVLKHAKAKNLRVAMRVNRRQAVAIIRDDGIGLDSRQSSPGLRAGRESIPMGLSGMKERAELLGGKFYLRSRPQKGTRIAVVIPLQSQTEEL